MSAIPGSCAITSLTLDYASWCRNQVGRILCRYRNSLLTAMYNGTISGSDSLGHLGGLALTKLEGIWILSTGATGSGCGNLFRQHLCAQISGSCTHPCRDADQTARCAANNSISVALVWSLKDTNNQFFLSGTMRTNQSHQSGLVYPNMRYILVPNLATQLQIH